VRVVVVKLLLMMEEAARRRERASKRELLRASVVRESYGRRQLATQLNPNQSNQIHTHSPSFTHSRSNSAPPHYE